MSDDRSRDSYANNRDRKSYGKKHNSNPSSGTYSNNVTFFIMF